MRKTPDPALAKSPAADPRDFVRRRQALSPRLRALKLDAVLISSTTNVGYLSGFRGEDSWLIVAQDHGVLLTDSRFVDQAAEECSDLEVVVRPKGATMDQVVRAELRRHAFCRVGVEGSHLSIEQFERLKAASAATDWLVTHGLVEELRAIKDAGEIVRIRAAIQIAERAFAMFRSFLTPEMTEKDAGDALESFVRRAGGEATSFRSIVAAGPRAALPHAPPTHQPITNGEMLLVDWGARSEGYVSDLTRMLLHRPPTKRFLRVYEAALGAQAAAISTIGPGVTGAQVDAAARQFITRAGFGSRFTHSVGHGVGREVHEAPSLRLNADRPLRPGMVVTVEPGIYLPDWGGVRIEDMVLVTKSGAELLSSLRKDVDQLAWSN